MTQNGFGHKTSPGLTSFLTFINNLFLFEIKFKNWNYLPEIRGITWVSKFKVEPLQQSGEKEEKLSLRHDFGQTDAFSHREGHHVLILYKRRRPRRRGEESFRFKTVRIRKYLWVVMNCVQIWHDDTSCGKSVAGKGHFLRGGVKNSPHDDGRKAEDFGNDGFRVRHFFSVGRSGETRTAASGVNFGLDAGHGLRVGAEVKEGKVQGGI